VNVGVFNNECAAFVSIMSPNQNDTFALDESFKQKFNRKQINHSSMNIDEVFFMINFLLYILI
jgi:hypothetical protein